MTTQQEQSYLLDIPWPGFSDDECRDLEAAGITVMIVGHIRSGVAHQLELGAISEDDACQKVKALVSPRDPEWWKNVTRWVEA